MMAINSQMFGTPKAVYQSSNINQLTPDWVNIAYQVNDSLLAGRESVKVDALLSILNLTSSYSQSDKISSGYSVNILAQQLAKTLADVSAKIYANQSPKFTGNQSGEYFSGYKSAGILRYSNLSHSKRGEFTPFAKGDFSHLSKEENYPHWQGLIWVTTRGGIEFCESIKGKVIEFFESIKKGKIELLDTIKKERIEFLQSIKKGSQSATLGNVDIEYRASENINISLLLWYGKYQLLDLTPNLSSSLRQAVLTHALNGSSPITEFICSSKSSSKRIIFMVLRDLLNAFFSFLSCTGKYHYDSLLLIGKYHNTGYPNKKAMPCSASTLTGHLITNDNHTIEVTMSKHNTPVTGRTSLTPNQSYRWLFLALNRSDYTAKPCRIAVTAPNENSARLMLVRDYMLIFAGRLPAIGGKHHA
ncbi:host cell division inhibitor Icd-like protein [Providencia huaxiensis]|uniref:host cell division inhibitor Icd-like protein n=2 Tax=Morganellaceae TaxID=1903414 RepID=UPI003BABFF01